MCQDVEKELYCVESLLAYSFERDWGKSKGPNGGLSSPGKYDNIYQWGGRCLNTVLVRVSQGPRSQTWTPIGLEKEGQDSEARTWSPSEFFLPILFSAFLGVDFFLPAYRQLSSHSSGRGSPPHWAPSQKTLTKEGRVLLLGPAQNIPGWDTLGWQVPLYTNHWSQEASCVSLNSVSFTFLMYKIETVLAPTRNSLLVQWLALCASNTGDMGSLSGQRTKIPHAMWSSQKKKTDTSHRWLLWRLKSFKWDNACKVLNSVSATQQINAREVRCLFWELLKLCDLLKPQHLVFYYL